MLVGAMPQPLMTLLLMFLIVCIPLLVLPTSLCRCRSAFPSSSCSRGAAIQLLLNASLPLSTALMQLPLIAQPLLLSMLLMFIVVPSSCFVVLPLMLSYAVGMCMHEG